MRWKSAFGVRKGLAGTGRSKMKRVREAAKRYVVFKALCQMAQLLLKATFFLTRYRTVHDTHLSYLFIFLCLDELSWLLIVRPPLPCATTKRQHVDRKLLFKGHKWLKWRSTFFLMKLVNGILCSFNTSRKQLLFTTMHEMLIQRIYRSAFIILKARVQSSNVRIV